MLKIICDKCGKDCGLIAYDLLVRILHNPEPVSIKDTGAPHITSDNSSIRMTFCENCYKEMGMPNIYKTLKAESLKFKDKEE